jgi:hypothetical protein
LTVPEFASFWHGPLDALEYAGLASFARAGATPRLYSYDLGIEAPLGVEIADARGICPDESLLRRYRVAGKASLATFADMFRYQLIRRTGCCWIDTDILCLARPDFSQDAIVFGRQPEFHGESVINNAVLKLPSDHRLLDDLIAHAEDAIDKELSWGAIGPFLLTELAEKHGVAGFARDFTAFYPIEPDDFWKLLLPEWREAVVATKSRSTFLHLWGELFNRCGYDKSVCPPMGSFLYEFFERIGTIDRFARVYGEEEVRALTAEWMRKDVDGATTRVAAGRARACRIPPTCALSSRRSSNHSRYEPSSTRPAAISTG